VTELACPRHTTIIPSDKKTQHRADYYPRSRQDVDEPQIQATNQPTNPSINQSARQLTIQSLKGGKSDINLARISIVPSISNIHPHPPHLSLLSSAHLSHLLSLGRLNTFNLDILSMPFFAAAPAAPPKPPLPPPDT